MIAVYKHIAETSVIAPHYIRVCLDRFRVQALDRFAYDHERKYDSILQQPVLKKCFAPACSAEFNMEDALKNVLQV